ncbi:hypothetical protein N431DRAFT_390519 [Stipitochalara longipes BDJ]|nr:hypothetical protein N431DRAFT_390519 [Stipitochalara longipes BDJ]
MVSQDIPFDVLTKVLIACLTISCVFVALRSGARWFKNGKIPIATEDVFIYLGLATNIATSGLYLDLLPRLQRIALVEIGQLAPYPTIDTDIVTALKEVLSIQIFFWATLWSVKLSLLFMFKRLTNGLSLYTKIWWGVLVFSVLSFLGCVISAFESCSSMHAWFSPLGECAKSRDNVAKAASLWYALAVDMLTDLMIMGIPVQILYTLQISKVQKFSVGVVFTVGIITMIVAIIRVISLDSSKKNGDVSPTWLILFAVIEGTVALIVGCLPSFAIFIRGRVEASRTPYFDASTSHISSARAKAQVRTESIMLEDVEPAVFRSSSDERSNKELMDGKIVVTQVWTQKWHRAPAIDAEKGRVRNLGLMDDV